MRNEETDLPFVEFGDPERPYTAPRSDEEFEQLRNHLKKTGAPGGIRPFASLTCRIRVCGDVDGRLVFAGAEPLARREGSDRSLRSLVESASAETLTEGWCLRELSPWRAGRDPNPRPSGSKKNPNLRKINDLRSSDRHIAA